MFFGNKPKKEVTELDLYRSAFYKSLIGQALVSNEGNIISCNDALCNLLGYTKEELLKLNFVDITKKEFVDVDRIEFARLQRGEIEGYTMEKQYETKNKEIIWGRLNVIKLENSNYLEVVVGQVENITELKALLEERDQLIQELSNTLRMVRKSQHTKLIDSIDNARETNGAE